MYKFEEQTALPIKLYPFYFQDWRRFYEKNVKLSLGFNKKLNMNV